MTTIMEAVTSAADKPLKSSAIEPVIAGMLVVIFVFGIIGNFIVIYVLFCKRQTWNIATTYLFNLAVADAVFVCTLPFWAHAYLNRMQWSFGLFMCKAVAVASSLNMYASIFFLTAMSVDRWIAVVHATTVNTARSSVVARVVCAVVWLSAASFSVPRLIFQQVRRRSNAINEERNFTQYFTARPMINVSTTSTEVFSTISTSISVSDFNHYCMLFLPESEHKKMLQGLLEFFKAVIGFLIPMVVICVCYIRIVRTVRLKLISRKVKKERVALLAGLIIIAFFVCWLPLQVMTLYSALGGWWDLIPFDRYFYNKVYPFFVCLAYTNSCVNPFVYAFATTNFKNNFKELCGLNLARCKQTRRHKMKPQREENCTHLTHDKAMGTETKTLHLRCKIGKRNRGAAKHVDERFSGSSDDIFEPLHFDNARESEVGKPGTAGSEECRQLVVDDTNSGVKYKHLPSSSSLHHSTEF